MFLKRVIPLIIIYLLIIQICIAQVYIDVDEQNTHYDAIEFVTANKIMMGYEDGLFRYENFITKSEFTALCCRLLNLQEEALNKRGETPYFDVDGSHWASGYINVLAERGFLQETFMFMPDRYLDMGEAAAIFSTILQYLNKTDEHLLDNIEFRPDAAITRGETAQLVYNIMDREHCIIVNTGDSYFNTITVFSEYGNEYIPASYLEPKKIFIADDGQAVILVVGGQKSIIPYKDNSTGVENVIFKNNRLYLAKKLLMQYMNVNLDVIDRTIDIEVPDITADDNRIKGTLSLPEGRTAPYSGIVYEIYAEGVYTKKVYNRYVVINQNESAVQFELEVDTNDIYRVKYLQFSPDDTNDYWQSGYYSYDGTRSEENRYLPVLSGETVPLQVIPVKKLCGSISEKENIYDLMAYTDTLQARANTNNDSYTIFVPADIDKVYLKYQYNRFPLYYSSSGFTPYENEKEYVALSNAVTTVDITTIDTSVLSVHLSYENVKNDIYDYGEIVLIQKNRPQFNISCDYNDSKDVNITIPNLNNENFIMYINSVCGRGYIDVNGRLTQNIGEAMEISSAADTNVNVYITVKAVYGRIILPNNETAPEGGIDLNVSALNVVDGYADFQTMKYGYINIPEGENGADFYILIPNFDNVAVEYYVENNSYYFSGCYVDGAVLPKKDRDPTTQTYENITITMIKNSIISGKIIFPEKVAEQYSVSVYIGDYYDKVTVPVDSQYVNYTVYVPETFENITPVVNVYYDSPYVFANIKPISIPNQAMVIENLDFEAQKAFEVKGKICLPVIYGDTTVSVYLKNSQGNIVGKTNIMFGSSFIYREKEFTINSSYVFDEEVTVFYSVTGSGGIYSDGYYNDSATVEDFVDASWFMLSAAPLVTINPIRKYPFYLSVEWVDQNADVTIYGDSSRVSSGTLYTAKYDNNNHLITMQVCKIGMIRDGTSTSIKNVKQEDHIKVFLWDDNMQPISAGYRNY